MNVSAIAASTIGDTNAMPREASASKGPASAADRKKVAAQFEAILVRQFLSQSLGSLMKTGEGASGDVYGYMLTDVLAQKLTSGRGLGLAQMVEKQLTPHGLAEKSATSTQAHP
jgi:flagellar protein FlgJ